MESVTAKRWEIAQGSEKEYWEEFTKERLIKEETERHERKAKVLLEEWKPFVNITENTRILQIGCGPEDIITHLNIGKRYAIDPLADFYKRKFNLNYGDLEFLEARGEKIPFEDNFFDIVILANVLDHVENSQKVLSEIKRVLKKEGFFHFENLFYQKSFIKLGKIWSIFKKIFTGQMFNINHPFMFSLPILKKMVSDNFQIQEETIGREIEYYENMGELKKIKKQDKRITARMPLLFGLYGTINYMVICKKSI